MTGCINTSRPVPDSVFDNCRLSAEEHGLEHEVLTPEQVSARFPGYRLPPGFKVRSAPLPRGRSASECWACLSSCQGGLHGEPRMPAAPGADRGHATSLPCNTLSAHQHMASRAQRQALHLRKKSRALSELASPASRLRPASCDPRIARALAAGAAPARGRHPRAGALRGGARSGRGGARRGAARARGRDRLARGRRQRRRAGDDRAGDVSGPAAGRHRGRLDPAAGAAAAGAPPGAGPSAGRA